MMPQKKPNVIWIFGDQHRGQTLNCMGDPNVKTPNIDNLAARGFNFTRAVSGSPLCSPFRGSMLTGQYPHNCVPGHDLALPEGMPTIADVLNENGYTTAYFGKWHVDGLRHREKGTRPVYQHVGKERRGGFQTWLGYENNNNQYDCLLHGHQENGEEVERFRLEKFETDALTDIAIDHIRKQAEKDQPFFTVISPQPPHHPYIAPPEWLEQYKPSDMVLRPNVPPVDRITRQAKQDLAGYCAMINNLDWNIGRIVRLLEELKIYDDTYIIFFSDHGDMLGSHGKIFKCVPHEESIRIPFVISGGRWDCDFLGGTFDNPVNHVDIAPTTLGLCGIDVTDAMAGYDYSKAVFGASSQEGGQKSVPYDMPTSALLQVVDPGYGDVGFALDRERPWRGVVTQDGWKYAVHENTPWLMFNLNEDPYELANLADDRRFYEQRKHLQQELQQLMDKTGDSFPLPNID